MTLAAERITPKVGVHRRVPFAEYVAWDAMNWHTLEPFRVSAKRGRLAMTLPDDASDAQALGGAFHSAVLEPALFDSEYAAMPQFDGHPNSNAHKQAKADWLEANRDKVSITARERAALLAMSQAVRAHPIAAAVLRGAGKNELSIVWRDKPTGVLCKGRVDRVCRVKIGVLDGAAANPDDDALCLVDFKTTRAIGIEAFDKEIAKFAYHAQLAMYLDGLNALDPAPLHPFIVAVENEPPYDVAVRSLDETVIAHGRRLYRRLLDLLLSCERTKRWPGVSDGVVPVVLPKWAEEPEGLETTL